MHLHEHHGALLSRQTVAQQLGVSVQSVDRLLASHELVSVRVGKRFVRITAESLEQYLARNRKEA